MSFILPFLYRQLFYTPRPPTASFQGKTVVVTGSNVGLGLEACRWMVRLGASRVILACRNIEKGRTAARDIQATTGCSSDALDVWQLNMSSYASVQAFSDRVNAELPRLDVLIANAGVYASTFRMAEDNEETLTVNVVSLFLLGFLLLPKLRETAAQHKTQTHFTVTSSELHEIAKFEERKAPPGQIFATLNDKSTARMNDRYPTSKLLEILVVRQMAALSPLDLGNVIINCVNPGMCTSELGREFDYLSIRIIKKLLDRTTEVGSRTLVYGASVGGESHGQYVPDCKIEPARGLCKEKEAEEMQSRVWGELREKLEAIRPGVTSLS